MQFGRISPPRQERERWDFEMLVKIGKLGVRRDDNALKKGPISESDSNSPSSSHLFFGGGGARTWNYSEGRRKEQAGERKSKDDRDEKKNEEWEDESWKKTDRALVGIAVTKRIPTRRRGWNCILRSKKRNICPNPSVKNELHPWFGRLQRSLREGEMMIEEEEIQVRFFVKSLYRLLLGPPPPLPPVAIAVAPVRPLAPPPPPPPPPAPRRCGIPTPGGGGAL